MEHASKLLFSFVCSLLEAPMSGSATPHKPEVLVSHPSNPVRRADVVVVRAVVINTKASDVPSVHVTEVAFVLVSVVVERLAPGFFQACLFARGNTPVNLCHVVAVN